MGRVIQLEQARLQQLARRVFAPWPRRLGYRPRPEERFSQLPDRVLDRLAELDQAGTLALYDLALGVRGWGPGEKFPYLEARGKMEALDAYLFLADQVRFELMRRLGWLEGIPGQVYPMLELARNYRGIMSSFRPSFPRLTEGYPGYQEVRRRLALEPAAVVRSLIPEALERFHRRCRQG